MLRPRSVKRGLVIFTFSQKEGATKANFREKVEGFFKGDKRVWSVIVWDFERLLGGGCVMTARTTKEVFEKLFDVKLVYISVGHWEMKTLPHVPVDISGVVDEINIAPSQRASS